MVRAYELARGNRPFEYMLRVRPDHLFTADLPSVFNVSVGDWQTAEKAVIAVRDQVSDLAVVDAAAAAVYFNAFDAATSCLLATPSPISLLLPQRLQCWRAARRNDAANCLVEALLAMHNIKIRSRTSRHLPMLARLCNVNETTGVIAWPAWPMPQGTTCVTHKDLLKRPRMEVGTSAEIGPDVGADANSAIGVVCVLVGVACLASAFFASGRCLSDLRAARQSLPHLLSPALEALELAWSRTAGAAFSRASEALSRRLGATYNVMRLLFQPVRSRMGFRAVPGNDPFDDDF